jgi:outer membrane lipoprotein-sorting protein
MKITKLFLLAFLSLNFISIQAQDLDEILASHFEAVNNDALAKVQTIHMTGKSGRMGQMFNFEIWQARPNKFRMEVDIQGQKMIQVYNGEKAWIVAPWTGSIEPQEVGTTELTQFKEQADIDGELYNWEDKGSKVTYEGSEDFEGTEVHIIKLITQDGNEKNYFIDGDTFLAVKMSSKIMMQGSEISADGFMSNYKEVNDIVMPFYIENQMNGEVASTITLENVEFDVEVDDKLFEKPEAK